jgi:hypothetical protein
VAAEAAVFSRIRAVLTAHTHSSNIDRTETRSGQLCETLTNFAVKIMRDEVATCSTASLAMRHRRTISVEVYHASHRINRLEMIDGRSDKDGRFCS